MGIASRPLPDSSSKDDHWRTCRNTHRHLARRLHQQIAARGADRPLLMQRPLADMHAMPVCAPYCCATCTEVMTWQNRRSPSSGEYTSASLTFASGELLMATGSSSHGP